MRQHRIDMLKELVLTQESVSKECPSSLLFLFFQAVVKFIIIIAYHKS
uniref:Uncharacterized protein n=1 Tax=Amphimedon queenslandica TaxID=400682 RepID=A0A1X7VQD1_AMPQE